MNENDSHIGHAPCPECGSKDNLGVWEDDHGFCFSCGYRMPTGAIKWMQSKGGSEIPTNATRSQTDKKNSFQPLGEFKRIDSRKISETVCAKMKYGIGSYRDKNGNEAPAQLVNVYDGQGHKVVAQKVRMKPKDFRYYGATAEAGLIFQNIFPAGSSKRLIITEGEIDALSVVQCTDANWAVVSLPNGTKSVKVALKNAYEYVMSFKEIIIAFDSDEPGRDATELACRLIGPKARIARCPEGMDLNDLHKVEGEKSVLHTILNAQPYRPEGVVALSSLRDDLLEKTEAGRPWIYDTLTAATYGRRDGEVYFFGAGSGIGKTDFFLQQAVADVTRGEGVAMFLLEQPVKETSKRLCGKYARKRFHIPDVEYEESELLDAFDTLSQEKVFLFNHFGSKDWDSVSKTIRWLAETEDIKDFYIDHLTALTAFEDDERKALERICADMSGLSQELGVCLYVISHLATPEGKPHEEGGRVMAKHFKGSRAIVFWAHFMFGFERNTQASDIEERLTTTFRVLKDRYTGKSTGLTFYLGYEEDTGMLFEYPETFKPDWLDSKESAGSSFNNQNQSDF